MASEAPTTTPATPTHRGAAGGDPLLNILDQARGLMNSERSQWTTANLGLREELTQAREALQRKEEELAEVKAELDGFKKRELKAQETVKSLNATMGKKDREALQSTKRLLGRIEDLKMKLDRSGGEVNRVRNRREEELNAMRRALDTAASKELELKEQLAKEVGLRQGAESTLASMRRGCANLLGIGQDSLGREGLSRGPPPAEENGNVRDDEGQLRHSRSVQEPELGNATRQAPSTSTPQSPEDSGRSSRDENQDQVVGKSNVGTASGDESDDEDEDDTENAIIKPRKRRISRPPSTLIYVRGNVQKVQVPDSGSIPAETAPPVSGGISGAAVEVVDISSGDGSGSEDDCVAVEDHLSGPEPEEAEDISLLADPESASEDVTDYSDADDEDDADSVQVAEAEPMDTNQSPADGSSNANTLGRRPKLIRKAKSMTTTPRGTASAKKIPSCIPKRMMPLLRHGVDESKPLHCLCGNKWQTEVQLKNHIRYFSNVRIFACHLCPKAFRDGAQLKKHRKAHGKPRRSTTGSNRRGPRKVVEEAHGFCRMSPIPGPSGSGSPVPGTSSAVSPGSEASLYVCKCGGRFPSNENFVGHMDGIKLAGEVQCEYCPLAFCSSANLKTHLKNFHKATKFPNM